MRRILCDSQKASARRVALLELKLLVNPRMVRIYCNNIIEVNGGGLVVVIVVVKSRDVGVLLLLLLAEKKETREALEIMAAVIQVVARESCKSRC